MLNIVLFQPQIPQNTGNIARTCAVTGAKLHLIGPLGFRTDAGSLKRAGLTYWHLLDVTEYANWEAFRKMIGNQTLHVLSSKARAIYTDAIFCRDDYILFGREDAGVPPAVLEAAHNAYRIPMIPSEEARCLNLATSVGIVLYEALRQQGFDGLT